MGLRLRLSFYRSIAFKNRPYFYPRVLFLILSLSIQEICTLSFPWPRLPSCSLVVCHRSGSGSVSCCYCCCHHRRQLHSGNSDISLKIHSINHRPRKQTCNHTHRARNTIYINNLFLGDHWNVFEQKVCCALTSHRFYSTWDACVDTERQRDRECRWRASENANEAPTKMLHPIKVANWSLGLVFDFIHLVFTLIFSLHRSISNANEWSNVYLDFCYSLRRFSQLNVGDLLTSPFLPLLWCADSSIHGWLKAYDFTLCGVDAYL